MFVYVLFHGIAYEGESLLGVFSDYVKAREYELDYSKRYGVSRDSAGEWLSLRKVELNRVYDAFSDVGEELNQLGEVM